MSIIFLLLLQIITTSSQTQSGVAKNFFIDVFQSKNTPFTGNSPNSEAEYTPVANYPYVAYPMDTCTRVSNDFSTAYDYAKWKCSQSGNLASRCSYDFDDTCGVSVGYTYCDTQTFGSASWDIQATTLIFGEGECECIDNPNDCRNDKGKYYMEIGYYKGYFDSNTGCPGTILNTQISNQGFEYAGFARFATGICVKQDNNEYIQASCNRLIGELAVYTDPSCTNKDRTLISYSTTCEFFDNPQGGATTFRYFRRLEGCYVNDNDIQIPTPSPTFEPTKSPSKSPSKSPTTPIPSKSPTTPIPSGHPTITPSKTPTLPSPTKAPTLKPTINPTLPTTAYPTRKPPTRTRNPTKSPSMSPTATDRVKQAKDIAAGLGMMEYAIIGGSVALLCICCVLCCWYKKKQLKEIQETHSRTRRNKRRQIQLMKQKQMQQQQQQRQIVRQISPGIDGDTQPFTVV